MIMLVIVAELLRGNLHFPQSPLCLLKSLDSKMSPPVCEIMSVETYRLTLKKAWCSFLLFEYITRVTRGPIQPSGLHPDF